MLAAFFDSGGLNAGTPLAIASTPVSATEPLANARRSSTMPQRLGAQRHRLGLARQRDAPCPVAMWTTPMATMTSARPTNR